MSERLVSERRRVALAEAIASAWVEGPLAYAVVHGLERYPEYIGRDLDVVLHQESVRTAVETALACGREHGFGTALFRWSHWGLYQLALLDPDDSTALALDLLCTTGVWRAKWVRLVNGPLLDRIAAGDGRVGPFIVSEEGRFLKSCLRPVLCGDLSRLGEGREWSLPVTLPDDVDRGSLEELLGDAGITALLSALSTSELREILSHGPRSLQGRWIRSHPLAAIRSLGDAARGRILRHCLNPAACVFVASPSPEVVFGAAQDLAEEARRMFVDVRPAVVPGSRLARIVDEATVWRRPPISEFVVTVIVGDSPRRWRPTAHRLAQFLPSTQVAFPGGLARDEVRAVLRACVVDFLARTYSTALFLGRNAPGHPADRLATVVPGGAGRCP